MARCRLFLVLAFLCYVTAEGNLSEGDECLLPNGSKGVCALLKNCAPAIEDVGRGDRPVTCSYSGLVPIVCCSKSPLAATESTFSSSSPKPTRRPIPPGYISEIKCGEYSRSAFEMEDSVITGEKIDISECRVNDKTPLNVTGGGNPAYPREFPHAVLIGFGEESDISWRCGGTLIDSRFVITSAYCLHFSKSDARWVRVGDLNIKETTDDAKPQQVEIIERIPHPDYRPPASYNDIALLKLAKDVELNEFVRPACLHTTIDISYREAVAIGWGLSNWDNQNSSGHLMKMSLPLLPTEACDKAYKSANSTEKLLNGINEHSMLCAGYIEGEKDTCKGDSGGALHALSEDVFCMYDLIGITSFGKVVCEPSYSPSVFTRVSHYISWIEKIVWKDWPAYSLY